MSAPFIARRALLRPAVAARRTLTTTPRRLSGRPDTTAEQKAAVQEEAKRNPEIYILGAIMVTAFAGAGYYFGSSPTSTNSEATVAVAEAGMPWQGDHPNNKGKYQYYPGADPRKPPKDAPSALNVTIVPDVVLPKHLHDQYNKWGKEDV